jgi:mannitol/fructose-specific phosphotransferase system IIA component (Ntr-type)
MIKHVLHYVEDPSKLFTELIQRESLSTTGVGAGLAIPHCRSTGVHHEIVVAATLKTPIDWDSVDSEPVQLVFMIIGAELDLQTHLRILTHTFYLIRNNETRSALIQAKNRNDFLKILIENERKETNPEI